MRFATLSALCATGLVATAAQAVDLPDMKAGLWESSTTMEKGAKPVHSTMCMDKSVYKHLEEQQERNPNRLCKSIASQHSGAVYTSTTQCQFPNRKPSVSTTVMTMSGDTGYHTELRGENQAIEMVIDAKYVGACPAGMSLGDVTGPDGKVMFNVLK
jgi:hypothetical protein